MSNVPKDVKGKGRATETTPLLSNGAPSNNTEPPAASVQHTEDPDPQQHRHDLRRTLLNVFLGSLTAIIVVSVLGVLLVYSFAQRVRGVDSDKLAQAIIWSGPSAVNVIEVKDGGEVIMDIKGLIGVDTDTLMDFKDGDNDTDNVFVSLWKDIGRWGVGLLREVTINMGQLVAYEVGHQDPLLEAHADAFTVPLTDEPGKPWDPSWLKPISFRVKAKPSQDGDLLQRFAQATWSKGAVDVRMEVDTVKVHGGGMQGKQGWRGMVKDQRKNVTTHFQYKIPDLPGLPTPHPPLTEILQLISYSLIREDDKLQLYALATVPNPLGDMKFHFPSIPYEVSLLAPPLQPLKISAGNVRPVLTPPNISLPITGHILPLESLDSSVILSSFLGQFLRGIPPPIAINCPLLPNLTIETAFPTPDPPPRILQNVTIKHMSVSVTPTGGMLATGNVWAAIVLPPGPHVPINATYVWPDVLVFDGPLHPDPEDPSEDHHHHHHLPHLPKVGLPGHPKVPHFPTPELPDLPVHLPGHKGSPTHSLPWPFPHSPSDEDDPPPLPTPLPERAFARIRPTDWVAATTIEYEDCDSLPKDAPCNEFGEDAGWKAVVTAHVERVPLQVLPGRDKEFRDFLHKVLWSRGGATAGIQGVAGVRAKVKGLMPGNGDEDDEQSLELYELPFEGNVLVGKKSL